MIRGFVEKHLDSWKRFGFSSLWLLALQCFSCLICYGVLSLFGRNYEWEWLVYGVSIALPFLWIIGGYWLLIDYRPRGWRQHAPVLILWTFLPAALCWWADQGGPDILLITLCPQLMARLAWFFPLFDGPQSAYVLNTLHPLAAAGTHGLLMAGFALGLHTGRRRKRKKIALI